MSFERTLTITCDRCTKVVRSGTGDESDWPDTDTPSALIITAHGKQLVILDDLCAKCQSRVDALVAKFTLKAGAQESLL